MRNATLKLIRFYENLNNIQKNVPRLCIRIFFPLALIVIHTIPLFWIKILLRYARDLAKGASIGRMVQFKTNKLLSQNSLRPVPKAILMSQCKVCSAGHFRFWVRKTYSVYSFSFSSTSFRNRTESTYTFKLSNYCFGLPCSFPWVPVLTLWSPAAMWMTSLCAYRLILSLCVCMRFTVHLLWGLPFKL